MTDTFKCASCGGSFTKARSDADAYFDLQARWPGITMAECALVCGKCFGELIERPTFNPRLEKLVARHEKPEAKPKRKLVPRVPAEKRRNTPPEYERSVWRDVLPPVLARFQVTDERQRRFLRAYRAGATMTLIAKKVGLSRGRVAQLIHAAENAERRERLTPVEYYFENVNDIARLWRVSSHVTPRRAVLVERELLVEMDMEFDY